MKCYECKRQACVQYGLKFFCRRCETRVLARVAKSIDEMEHPLVKRSAQFGRWCDETIAYFLGK
jgi:hypothetical protein